MSILTQRVPARQAEQRHSLVQFPDLHKDGCGVDTQKLEGPQLKLALLARLVPAGVSQ